MEFKNIKQRPNPLLDRIELEIMLEAKPTPSRQQLREAIAKYLSKDAKLIAIREITQHFGTSDVVVKAFIYNSEEALKKHEHIKKKDAEAMKQETSKQDETKEQTKQEENQKESKTASKQENQQQEQNS